MGLEGGATGQVSAGAMWDTRDNESDPVRGGVDASRMPNWWN